MPHGSSTLDVGFSFLSTCGFSRNGPWQEIAKSPDVKRPISPCHLATCDANQAKTDANRICQLLDPDRSCVSAIRWFRPRNITKFSFALIQQCGSNPDDSAFCAAALLAPFAHHPMMPKTAVHPAFRKLSFVVGVT